MVFGSRILAPTPTPPPSAEGGILPDHTCPRSGAEGICNPNSGELGLGEGPVLNAVKELGWGLI